MAEIKYVCKRTVVSTKPVPPGKLHHLSVLDRAMEHNNLRLVYYYKTSKGRETGELTRGLGESMSEMLSSFPAVTGRLLRNAEGQWMIKCNDAGVRMVEARAKGSVEGWLKSMDREKELKLVHWEDMYPKQYFWSTFYVQITEFEEGGLAIGLSCIHLLADPTCAAVIVKAWADTTLGGKMINPPFFHPLPPRRPGNRNINHKLYTDLIDHYKSSMMKSFPTTTTASTTITLAFSDEMVQSCIAMAQTLDVPGGLVLSPFEVLAGLFWVCVSNAKGITNGLTSMSLCLDMRKVLGLDKGFFGNCSVYNRVYGECLELENRLAKAAFAVRAVVRKMDVEGTMDLIEWLEGTPGWSPPYMNAYDLICTNFDGVDPYLAIFEDSFKPVHVSCYIEPALGQGQVLILPSPPNEGTLSRVVMVTLPEDEITRLCEDELLLQFNPTILMGLNKNQV
ncbi:Rosmarinate synthase [Bertholletia excelsa]